VLAHRTQGEDKAAGASDDVIFKIDIPANRYDLLCLEGIARALRIFLRLDRGPVFTLVAPPKRQRMTVTAEVRERHAPACPL